MASLILPIISLRAASARERRFAIMASLEKRGNKYRMVVSVMQDGARRKVSKTFDTKKAAKAWAILMEANKLQDKSIISSKMLFADYFKKWMETYKKNDVRESTYAGYKYVYGVIQREFPDYTLDELTYTVLQTKLDKIGKKLRQSTVLEIVSKIKASLSDAKYEQYITTDIYSRIKPHGIKIEKSPNVLSATNFEKLQKHLYEIYQQRPLYAVILVGLETGLRIGEIMALTGKDFSEHFNSLKVDKAYSNMVNKVTPPKNKNAFRTIKITDHLIEVLKFYSDDPNQRIFTMSEAAVAHNFSILLKELNIPRITIHGLRHSHASYLIYKGISINYVSARLGHADVSITQRVYAHMLKEEKSHEQEKTIELLSMSPNVPRQKKKPLE